MRKIYNAAAVLLTVGVAVLVASPAHADGPAVLTTGSVGGANVAVGDVISSGLLSGTTAKFLTTSGGSTGVTCAVSAFTGSVLTNPDAGGVATESLTAQTFSSCTSNISGVTGVQSITVNNLPYSASVDGTSKAITVTSSSTTPIQATVRLSTVLGTVTCVYRAVNNTFSGVTSNTDNSLAFTSQQFSKSSGSLLCPGSSFFTASYAPATDTSVAGSPLVFVQ